MASADEIERIRDALDTSQIKHWRSVITLVVFVMTSEYYKSDAARRKSDSLRRHQRAVSILCTGLCATRARPCHLKHTGRPACYYSKQEQSQQQWDWDVYPTELSNELRHGPIDC